MKTEIFIIGVLAIFISSCDSLRYLPATNKIDIHPYGSRIMVIRNSGPEIHGELIASDSNQVVVLTDIDYIKPSERKLVIIPSKEIKRFRLQYARSKPPWWTIPVFTVATASHGNGFLITTPVNLLVTILLTTTWKSNKQYNNRHLSYEDLKMFARFPQGIPANIDITSLK